MMLQRVFAVLPMFLLVTGLAAQQPTAQITGLVTDSSGAVVPGAQIKVVSADTGMHWEAQSNESGNYAFSNLRPGNYQITVSRDGFATVNRSGVVLEISQVARLDFSLKVGGTGQSVEVTAAAPLLESSTASVGQLIETKAVSDLPLNGRNYLQLAKLSSGVLEAKPGDRNAAGGSFIANGVRAQLNNFLLDGVDNNSKVVDQQNSSTAPDPGLEGLALSKVSPGTIIPGTKIVVKGDSFVDTQWGTAVLHLQGGNIDVSWPATFVDFGTLNVAVDRADLDQVGGDAQFHGTATIEYTATSDEQVYKTDPLTLDLTFAKALTPSVTHILDGVHFVNDPIEVDGDGFLLGGNEGQTFARLTGCFQLDAGGSCTPITQIDVQMQPLEDFSRAKSQWAFVPKIAGIQPGSFTGQVTIVNMQAGGTEVAAAPVDVSYTMVTAQVFRVDPPAASLGQYVFVHGGGFVGGEANALTELELVGTFTKTGGSPAQVSMHLIPDFVDGPLVRYVLNTDDELGHSLDLRKDTGHFTGTMTPIIHYGSDTVNGTGAQVTFDIAPVKQVVYLSFEPAYVEELRDFGLRAVDKQIRDRILAVCNRSYKGVNIEFRTDPVTDFALFENVDLVGVDPNDMGLFGYDNSPGKDNGNVRLYDQLGGVNAVTQQDGYPGYGGVFLRSLMGFSNHPGSFAQKTPGADANFDKTFDPFRPDVDGHPITAADLATAPAVLTDGTSCPGKDRATQISCAIYVMGNLVGGTLSHEIGHSLGLANPYADGFHDAGDQPNRLMDAGGDRPFLERAEILGQGPGVFCDDEYAYLRQIMPSNSPPDNSPRPSCF